MKEFIYLNGKFISKKNALIPVSSNSLHYGTAVFEGIRSYKIGKRIAVFKLKEHIKRLFKSAKFMYLKPKITEKKLISVISLLLKKNKLTDAYIRPIIFFEGNYLLLNKIDFPVSVAVMASKQKKFFEGKKGIKLMVSSFRRTAVNKELFEVKVSGNYSVSFLAKINANKKGFDDALMLNEKNQVAEASAENIFYVKKRILFIPKINGILEGITRNSVIEIAKGMKLKIKEKNVKLKELLNAEEVFVTGTAAGIVSVKQINKKKFKLKKNSVTEKLIHEFELIIHGKNQDYLKWLEFV
ncbi:MAG: branched-chain amino acid transaminase [Candidatus Diapherotrites archaeon]